MLLICRRIGGLLIAGALTVGTSSSAHAAFLSFGYGGLTLLPGDQKVVGNVTLRLTATDDFQVVDHTGAILWHSNTTADCSTVTCNAGLGTDGNLVVNGPNPPWSAKTYGTYGSLTVCDQSAYAYLTVRDFNYAVAWTSGGDACPGMYASTLSSTKASSAQTFLASLGVNSHQNQYETDASVVKSKLDFLGIKQIRDSYTDSLAPNYRTLAQDGVHFDIFANSPSDMSQPNLLAGMAPGALTALEGPNEINNFPFSCGGNTWQSGWPNPNGPAAQCFMTQLLSAVKSDSTLHGVSVYDLTGGNSATNAAQYGLLDITNQADYANIHPYPKSTDQPYFGFLSALAETYNSVLPAQAVITETGYSTSNGVSGTAASVLDLNIYLDSFLEGYKQCYIYELTDNSFEGYGFFDTSNNPKTAANAVHNFTTILADNGSVASPGTLNYSLVNLPAATGHSLLLQKSNGHYQIIVWNEIPIWNGGDIAVTPINVAVNLGASFSGISVYDPIQGTTAIQQVAQGASVTLSLGSHPLIIDVPGTGSGVSTPAPVMTPTTSAFASVGSLFSFQITATNSPTTFSATGLPSGLTANASGLISGTPTTSGTFTINLSVSNAGGTALGTLTLTVSASSTTRSPFLTFGYGGLTMLPGDQKTVGAVTVRLTATDDFQVIDASGNILWHTNTTADCSKVTCNAGLGTDGNFVVNGPSPAWSAATYGDYGSLTMCDQPGYITVRDYNYNVVWSAAGDPCPGMLVSTLSPTKATMATTFLGSLGVNSHQNQYETDATVVKTKLDYMGIKLIRDGYQDTLKANYQTLANDGIHFDILTNTTVDFATQMTQAETLAAMKPGALTSIEGPNEINNFPFSCGGFPWASGWPNPNGPAAKCFMEQLYSSVHADPKLQGVSIFDLTGGNSPTNAAQYGLLDLANQADFGNVHPYPNTNSTAPVYGMFLASLAETYNSVLPQNAVITETGYSTGGGVDLLTQSIQILNLYLDSWAQGYKQCFIYELTDNAYEGFGMFDTSNNPKPSATSIRNFTTILADSPGTFAPATLNYSLSGLPGTAHALLLQKTNGHFQIVIWNEAPIWANGAEVAVPSTPVSLNLGATFSGVTVYDPLQGTTAIQTIASASTVPLSVGSHPLIVDVPATGSPVITPPNSTPPPTITNAATATATANAPFSLQITADNSPTSFSATGLPTGLAVNSSGLISGTPTIPGTYPVTVSATNAGGSGQATVTITVSGGSGPTPAAPVITSAATATATVSSAFTYQIAANNSPTSFGATGLPSGLSVNASGLISGTPTAAGSSAVTITATNATGTGQATLTITVSGSGAPPAAPVITSAATATATVNSAFTYQITASNSPTSFAATGLPSGLSVNSSGLISGTPTAVGASPVTITATNATGSGHATLTLTVSGSGTPPPAAPAITSAATATATVSTPFTYQITASNSPTGFGASGLPSGLTVDSSGLISGTPTGTGSSVVTITASNATGTGQATLTISVAGLPPITPPAPVITSAATAAATVNAPFLFQVTASNSPTSFDVTGLAAGLSMNSTGLISGTPTTAGTFVASLSAINAGGTGQGTLTITVAAVPPVTPPIPVIPDADRASATVNTSFVYQITGTNNPTSFGATGLPTGLTVDAAGLISGKPTTAGVYTVILSATNAGGTGHLTVTLTVVDQSVPPSPPAVTNPTSASVVANTAFMFQVTGSNSPTSFSATGLPAGLSISATGLISGTPTTAGVFPITLTVSNTAGAGHGTLTLTVTAAPPVLPPAPAITSPATAVASLNDSFTFQLKASNSPTSFAASGLPTGLSVNAAGMISGTPTVAGIYLVSVSASNAGGTGHATLTLTVTTGANIVLSKSSNVGAAASGDIATYTIFYQNLGTATATSVDIIDTIPAGTSLVFGSISAPGLLEGNAISWPIGTVPGLGTGQVSFQVKVNE